MPGQYETDCLYVAGVLTMWECARNGCDLCAFELDMDPDEDGWWEG